MLRKQFYTEYWKRATKERRQQGPLRAHKPLVTHIISFLRSNLCTSQLPLPCSQMKGERRLPNSNLSPFLPSRFSTSFARLPPWVYGIGARPPSKCHKHIAMLIAETIRDNDSVRCRRTKGRELVVRRQVFIRYPGGWLYHPAGVCCVVPPAVLVIPVFGYGISSR